ncbi:aromatic amino acid aminotransferase, partial [Enterobacter mori]
GMEDDAYAIRAVTSAGRPPLLSTSLSKIFSLYRPRGGRLSVVFEHPQAAGPVVGQLKPTVGRK